MITIEDTCGEIPGDRYKPYRTVSVWRKVDPPIMYNGKRRARYQARELEYLDNTSGEIIPAKELRQRAKLVTVHFSERCLQRETILDSLRPEVRKFAVFVLKFRNLRRGITPGIDTLCAWYAKLTGKQTSHVRRYVPTLKAAGVLDGDSLCGKLFQFSGKHTAANDHTHEDIGAEFRFAEMLLRNSSIRPPAGELPDITSLACLKPDHTGSWLPVDIGVEYLH